MKASKKPLVAWRNTGEEVAGTEQDLEIKCSRGIVAGEQALRVISKRYQKQSEIFCRRDRKYGKSAGSSALRILSPAVVVVKPNSHANQRKKPMLVCLWVRFGVSKCSLRIWCQRPVWGVCNGGLENSQGSWSVWRLSCPRISKSNERV